MRSQKHNKMLTMAGVLIMIVGLISLWKRNLSQTLIIMGLGLMIFAMGRQEVKEG